MGPRPGNLVQRLGALATIVCAAGLFATMPAAAQDPPAAEAARGETVPASTPREVGASDATPTPPSATGPAPAEAATDPAAPAPRARPPKKRRGGIAPCMTPDPGFGIYDRWSNVSVGQMIAPQEGGITKKGSFDVVIHFHGHEPIRKEFVKTADGIVLVGIDLGIGSGAYSSFFASPDRFTNLLSSIESQMSKRTGKEAKIRKIALSAWSAGYGAIEQILKQPSGKRIDAVVLLDSLHTGYDDDRTKALNTLLIEPFVQFAKRAAAGERFMFMSHSSIIPPGYASTTEVAHHVVKQLKGKPKKTSRQDVLGLDMIDRFDKSNFHMRGYTGDDKPDHCAHIGLMANIIKVHLEPRWNGPKGRAEKIAKGKGDKSKGEKSKTAKSKDDKSKSAKNKT
jgi:hypothetical protein